MEILFSCMSDYSADKNIEDFSIHDQANNNATLVGNVPHHCIDEKFYIRNRRT
jgi:hypothetical protein